MPSLDQARAIRVLTTWQSLADAVAATPGTPPQIAAFVAAFDVPMPLDGLWFRLATAINAWCAQQWPDRPYGFLEELLSLHNARVREREQ